MYILRLQPKTYTSYQLTQNLLRYSQLHLTLLTTLQAFDERVTVPNCSLGTVGNGQRAYEKQFPAKSKILEPVRYNKIVV